MEDVSVCSFNSNASLILFRSQKISGLRQKYDIVYLKTDLHFCLNSPFRPYGDNDVGDGLRLAIEEEMKPNYDGEALAEHLLNEFMKREARNEISAMEAICANAFEKIYEEDGRRFAFDSHIGGIILFLAKGEFAERSVLKRIAVSFNSCLTLGNINFFRA